MRRIAVTLSALTLAAALDGEASADPAVDAQLATLAQRNAGDPCDARVELHRGQLLRARGDLDAARAAFDAAAACDPTFVEADLARAELHLQAGRASQAAALLDLHADDARALVLRGRARMAQSRFAAAAADFDAALARVDSPQPEHFLERGEARMRAGQPAAAARGLEEALERLGPVPALVRRAVDVELQGADFDAALRHLDRTRRLPGQEAWLLRRGEVLQAAGRRCEARAAFEAAAQAVAARPAARRETQVLRNLAERARAEAARLGACEADQNNRSNGSYGTYLATGGTP